MQDNLNKLLETTANLIEQKEYDKALDLLNDELKNPLYSLEQQDAIKARIAALNKFIKIVCVDARWSKADKNELIRIFNSEGYERAVLNVLFDRFEKDLKPTDFLKLQQVFLDDSVSNESKIGILNYFKDSKVNHIFDYHNTLIDKTFKVDISKDFSLYSNELLNKVMDQLSALYFKETSKEIQAKEIVIAIYYYYFGDFSQIKYDYETLFNSIVDYVDNAFDNITPVNKDFANWIDKILNNNI